MGCITFYPDDIFSLRKAGRAVAHIPISSSIIRLQIMHATFSSCFYGLSCTAGLMDLLHLIQYPPSVRRVVSHDGQHVSTSLAIVSRSKVDINIKIIRLVKYKQQLPYRLHRNSSHQKWLHESRFLTDICFSCSLPHYFIKILKPYQEQGLCTIPPKQCHLE